MDMRKFQVAERSSMSCGLPRRRNLWSRRKHHRSCYQRALTAEHLKSRQMLAIGTSVLTEATPSNGHVDQLIKAPNDKGKPGQRSQGIPCSAAFFAAGKLHGLDARAPLFPPDDSDFGELGPGQEMLRTSTVTFPTKITRTCPGASYLRDSASHSH